MGTKNRKYFVHPSTEPDCLCLETDDTHTQGSAIVDIRGYARGMQKQVELATLSTDKALDFIQSLERDRLFREGKLHVYFGDNPPWSKRRLRTKIVFTNRNTAEVKSLCNQQGTWFVRGIAVTLVDSQKKHYGHVFFDRSPTAKVTKIWPVNDTLHEELADRLVKLL